MYLVCKNESKCLCIKLFHIDKVQGTPCIDVRSICCFTETNKIFIIPGTV